MTKIGRNAPCPCGSGLKYKRCCEERDFEKALDQVTEPMMGEIRLLDTVHNCILAGVWMGFHPPGFPVPAVEQLEEFYREIYGHDVHPDLVEEIVLPLSPYARARLHVPSVKSDDAVIDVASDTQNPSS